ncbi:MAG: UDP-glucose 4-epimerase [Blastocatellia bacterium]|jgi:UDP-glucose 4-epimerase|nr:UDP-glucose 4-epimerase [Blastocatellia bacterium]
MNILVTGGAGYIGSVVVEELIRDGHVVTVYDNLSKGHRESVPSGVEFVHAELLDSETLMTTLLQRGIEAVIHMAADSLVGESVAKPGKYYQNNVIAGLAMLESMRRLGVTRLVFSSTAAVYGEPAKQPIEECDPTGPTNTYGETKLAFERALHWYSRAYDLKYVALRYFNAAGASARCGEHHDPETHLIPIVLQVAAGERDQVEVYGDDYLTPDGSCVRDYIHVIDLARAHILALNILDEKSATYNLGCGGEGYSVREVIQIAREVTGRDIPIKVGPRRPGDPAVLIASSNEIKKDLGWAPRFGDLRLIIESAWTLIQKKEIGRSIPAAGVSA